MLNKRFCYLAGTGRTASHWVQQLINTSCDKAKVATFHDGFPKRARTSGRRTPVEFFQNYLLNLMVSRQGARVYIECNPALLEHVALTYGIRNAVSVIPGGMMPVEARGLLMVRHPYAYVASMKARGYGWGWWGYPQAQQVYEIGDGFTKRPALEQYAVAWTLKNQFYYSLTRLGVPVLKFEDLFGNVTRETFSERIRGIFEAFGIEPIQSSSFWWQLRDQRAAGKAKGATLSAAEQETVKRICTGMMEMLEYE